MGCSSWIEGQVFPLDKSFDSLSVFRAAEISGWKYCGNLWYPPNSEYGNWEEAPSNKIDRLLALSKGSRTLIGFNQFSVNSAGDSISLIFDIRKKSILIDLTGNNPKTVHGERAVSPDWALGLIYQLQKNATGYMISSVNYTSDIPW